MNETIIIKPKENKAPKYKPPKSLKPKKKNESLPSKSWPGKKVWANQQDEVQDLLEEIYYRLEESILDTFSGISEELLVERHADSIERAGKRNYKAIILSKLNKRGGYGK